ncbi:MAG: diguanylate cyclase [Alphaproteobacteria bacterium]|nr:diguanylate cyclase [Alphaproteobacteria bacterium]
MKIPDRTRQRPGARAGPAAATHPRTEGVQGEKNGAAAPEAGKPRSVEDVATLLGIPTTEMTPAIRRGLGKLIEDVVRLQQEIAAKDKRIAYLEKLVDEDPLMPVLNRRAFVRELSRSMAFAERYGIQSSVLFFDVNGMKCINDTHGHAAGDAALSHVAEILVANVRKSDIVGRLGGDEFGVILVQADEQAATTKGHSLAQLIGATPVTWAGKELFVGVSFGASCFSRTIKTADEALAYADRHMYADKRTRRNENTG